MTLLLGFVIFTIPCHQQSQHSGPLPQMMLGKGIRSERLQQEQKPMVRNPRCCKVVSTPSSEPWSCDLLPYQTTLAQEHLSSDKENTRTQKLAGYGCQGFGPCFKHRRVRQLSSLTNGEALDSHLVDSHHEESLESLPELPSCPTTFLTLVQPRERSPVTHETQSEAQGIKARMGLSDVCISGSSEFQRQPTRASIY